MVTHHMSSFHFVNGAFEREARGKRTSRQKAKDENLSNGEGTHDGTMVWMLKGWHSSNWPAVVQKN